MKPSNTLEQKLKEFSKRKLKIIMENTVAMQLTEGCSIGCSDCGLEAKKGVKDFIPFSLLKRLFSEYKDELANNCEMLYYASEPFDYKDKDCSYEDVHRLFVKETGCNPWVTTAMPKGKEKIILEHILFHNSLKVLYGSPKFIDRISVMPSNYHRINDMLMEVWPGFRPDLQWKVEAEFQVRLCTKADPAYDEPEKRRMRTALTENSSSTILARFGVPERDFYLDGQGRAWESVKLGKGIFTTDNKIKGEAVIHIVKLPSGDRIASSGGPVSLSHLIKYWEYTFKYGRRGSKSFGAPDGVSTADFYTLTNGKPVLKRLRLGEKNKDNLSRKGIGCFHGVLITPSGMFNVKTMRPTRQYPTGQRITPIEPKDFKVARCYYFTSFDKVKYGMNYLDKVQRKYRLIRL